MSNHAHWDEIYLHRAPEALSWYQPHHERSCAMIELCHMAPDSLIVDIGGGASTLVDELLARGFTRLAVVDLSEHALARSRARLGLAADAVRWIVADVTTPLFDEGSVALWHDRAVFHFLTEQAPRDAYIKALRRCVRPGGHVILATFDLDGPTRCSGLPVVRYGPDELAAVLGEGFELIAQAREAHITPSGASQAFTYVLCRRLAGQP